MRERRTRKLTATLTDADVAFAREAVAKGALMGVVADLLGCTIPTLSKMLRGVSYPKHVRRYERVRPYSKAAREKIRPV